MRKIRYQNSRYIHGRQKPRSQTITFPLPRLKILLAPQTCGHWCKNYVIFLTIRPIWIKVLSNWNWQSVLLCFSRVYRHTHTHTSNMMQTRWQSLFQPAELTGCRLLENHYSHQRPKGVSSQRHETAMWHNSRTADHFADAQHGIL